MHRLSKPRSSYIVHYTAIMSPDKAKYPGSNELLSIGSSFSKCFGFKKIGVHHELLLPGRRTSYPHAESSEEEFVYVLEGKPHVWIEGFVYQLKPGDGVGFPAGTGIAHTVLNNTKSNVRLLVVGEADKKRNKIVYPLNPELRHVKKAKWWENAPKRVLGPHSGRPKRARNTKHLRNGTQSS